MNAKAQYQPKQPPHDLVAEATVLGGLLLRNDLFGDVASLICAEDFYRSDHQQIFAGIAEMIGARRSCDFVTLTAYFRNKGQLDGLGGPGYIASLQVDTYSVASVIVAHAQVVRERATLRKLIAIGAEIGDLGYRPEGRAPDELLEHAERLVLEVRTKRAVVSGDLRPISEFVDQAERQIEEAHKSNRGMGGVSTGFRQLDAKIDGLHAGDLVIVAGRPGSGKTTLATNIAQNLAYDQGKRVAMFTMEMQGASVARRMQSSTSRLPLSKLRGGALTDGDWQKLSEAGEKLRSGRFLLDETGGLSPFELRGRVRRAASRGGLDLIVVDYVQLMQIPGSRENRTNQVAEISRSMKALAKEFGVPVLLLSQLTRDNEREKREPKLSDLRESGGLEQDPDLVLFVYRENIADEEPDPIGAAKIIIGKQRDGATGFVRMNFYGAVNRFEEMGAHEEQEWRDRQRVKVVAKPSRGFGSDRKLAAAGES